MRYTSLSEQDRLEMLKLIGVSSVDAFYKTIHSADSTYNLPKSKSESEVLKNLSALASKNTTSSQYSSFLGAGCYNHFVPASVDHLIQRGEILTSYTPYQPEVSQGTLQIIFEFQTIIARLTGMEVANASMYDGQTALAEAVMMACRVTKGRKKIHILEHLNPDYKAVLDSYFLTFIGEEGDVQVAKSASEISKSVSAESACVVVQIPDFRGNINENVLKELRTACDTSGAMLIVVVSEIVALGAVNPPSCADIVCGEAGSLGKPTNFGGPSVGFFATKKQFVRQMPGRICGATLDEDGKRGFVLTLNAREQHIRREKATSNICSNQGLIATAFTIHATLLGESGFKNLALLNHHKACELAEVVESCGGVVVNDSFFNEFSYSTKRTAKDVLTEMEKRKIFGGVAISEYEILVCVTEQNSSDEIAKYGEVLRAILVS